MVRGLAIEGEHHLAMLPSPESPGTDEDHDRDASLRHSRHNPFFRELTKDWTGLDDYPIDDGVPQNGSDTPAVRAPRDRGEEDGGPRQSR